VSRIQCACGKDVDAGGLHGLACHRRAPRQQRHSHMNDILWRAIKQLPAVKDPVSLVRQDGKRPDGATLLPWTRGKPPSLTRTPSPTYMTLHADQQLRQIRRLRTRPPSILSSLPLICSFQSLLKRLGHGTNGLLSWSKKLAGGSQRPLRITEKQYSYSCTCPLLSNSKMRSPSKAHSLPPNKQALQSFFV